MVPVGRTKVYVVETSQQMHNFECVLEKIQSEIFIFIWQLFEQLPADIFISRVSGKCIVVDIAECFIILLKYDIGGTRGC